MTSPRETPRSQRPLLAPFTLLFAALLVAGLLSDHRANDGPGGEPTGSTREPINGAHAALSAWGASRSYPGRDIPAAGFSRGYEYSVAELRRPLAEAFGHGSRGELRRGQGAGWQPIGPTNGGGRTLTIAFDPLDPDIVYAGAASGGLWRSATGGVGAAAWERVPTGLPELGVSTIAFEPGNSDVFYIGTGEVYNVDKAGDLEADRRTRGSYGIGILKTMDGGETWSKSLDWSYNQQHGVWMIRVDPFDSDTVWAATTEGVFKSTDAGANWELMLDVAMATDLVLHPNNPQVALAACGNLESADRGLYRTVDGGESWELITSGGLPADFEGKMQFGVTAADPDIVYLSIGNGFLVGIDNFTWLFRSDDFGVNWTLQTTTDYSKWQGWFAHDVAVHPTDPDTVICIGIDIWRSTDGGVTLFQESSSADRFEGPIPPGGAEGGPDYSHADHHDVVYHPTDPDIVYFANDGGVFRSLDGGVTFGRSERRLPVAAVLQRVRELADRPRTRDRRPSGLLERDLPRHAGLGPLGFRRRRRLGGDRRRGPRGSLRHVATPERRPLDDRWQLLLQRQPTGPRRVCIYRTTRHVADRFGHPLRRHELPLQDAQPW